MKAQKCHNDQQDPKSRFANGQELIWDSGSGFDVVVYADESRVFKGKMANCKMKTGMKKGNVSPLNKEQLTVFSLSKWAEMRKKYDLVS